MRRAYLLYGLLALLLLWLAFRQVSPLEIMLLLGQLRFSQICILILLNGLVLVALVLRWYLLLWAEGYRLPWLALLRYRLAAFGVTYFTPGPQFGGEPLQVYLVNKHHGVPLHSAIAVVTVDKVLEMVANFGFMVGGTVLLLRQGMISDRLGVQGLITGLLLLAVPLLLLIAYLQGRHPLTALSGMIQRLFAPKIPMTIPSRLRRIETILTESEGQITALCRRHPVRVAWAFFATIIGWGVMVWEFAYATRTLGTPLTMTEVVMVLLAARIAFLLPMPAGVGTLESSLVLAFQLLGFTPAAGLALSLLIRVRDVGLGLLGLGFGGAAFLRRGQSNQQQPGTRHASDSKASVS